MIQKNCIYLDRWVCYRYPKPTKCLHKCGEYKTGPSVVKEPERAPVQSGGTQDSGQQRIKRKYTFKKRKKG